ncbi:TolC family protein [Leptobacterium flavescens]|uniref:TolC family protein n=1 Tax=Leptobacterium flavescens TaxID=472055 RepID=A0A6P0US47_9FLAO|nr:TolC family protein [Leptobacterium flavescens]NER15352.1 TolC family protein [Leptobacterium flavescens]
MRSFILILFCSWSFLLNGQEVKKEINTILSLKEFLELVRKYHPVAGQAELTLKKAQAGVTRARGEFDPKLEFSYEGKEFLGSDYFDILKGGVKIPTWYGIEFNAGYEDTDGSFLNPQNFIPDDGRLFSAGVKVPLGEGLFINERMATLRKAKIFRELSVAEQKMQINKVLSDAGLSYFDWLKAHREFELYDEFLRNAEVRLEGVKNQVIRGDKAAIDSVEAGIVVKNRKLGLEQARLNYLKAQLKLSNFLWTANRIPVELEPHVVPQEDISGSVDEVLEINMGIDDAFALEQHPKIITLDQKIKVLEVEKKLKADKLKPRLDAYYNFLSSDAERINTFNTRDFKAGFKFSLGLFLRKERGEVKIAKYKIQDAELDYRSELLRLKNKITSEYNETLSVNEQLIILDEIRKDYDLLLKAEERKFSLGESSVFLVNQREKTLLDTGLKQIEVENKLFRAKVRLFNSLIITPGLP